MKCPIATYDIKVNLKNRNWAFKNVNYGPANPLDENEEYWNAVPKNGRLSLKMLGKCCVETVRHLSRHRRCWNAS